MFLLNLVFLIWSNWILQEYDGNESLIKIRRGAAVRWGSGGEVSKVGSTTSTEVYIHSIGEIWYLKFDFQASLSENYFLKIDNLPTSITKKRLLVLAQFPI